MQVYTNARALFATSFFLWLAEWRVKTKQAMARCWKRIQQNHKMRRRYKALAACIEIVCFFGSTPFHSGGKDIDAFFVVVVGYSLVFRIKNKQHKSILDRTKTVLQNWSEEQKCPHTPTHASRLLWWYYVNVLSCAALVRVTLIVKMIQRTIIMKFRSFFFLLNLGKIFGYVVVSLSLQFSSLSRTKYAAKLNYAKSMEKKKRRSDNKAHI